MDLRVQLMRRAWEQDQEEALSSKRSLQLSTSRGRAFSSGLSCFQIPRKDADVVKGNFL